MTELVGNDKNKLMSENSVSVDDLPTSPEIAIQGYDDYMNLFSNIPETVSENVRDEILTNEAIKQCFAGITPHRTVIYHTEVPGFDSDDIEDFVRLLDNPSGDYVAFASTLPATDEEPEATSITMINLNAAEKIIRNNLDQFPEEARLDSKSWLRTNATNLKEVVKAKNINWHTIHGLLSGYSRWSVSGIDGNTRRHSKGDYVRNEQIGLIFESTDLQRDEEYLQQLQEIYNKSGMGALSNSSNEQEIVM